MSKKPDPIPAGTIQTRKRLRQTTEEAKGVSAIVKLPSSKPITSKVVVPALIP